jgi:proteic killer suppression protein
MSNIVILTKNAARQLDKAPVHIVQKLAVWALTVEKEGIRAARQTPGYHDEPLEGRRWGQRSIRLSRKWRAIYIEVDEAIQIHIIEVTPHVY